MMKETDIFNDLDLQNDIQDLAAIEQGVLRANCPLPDLDAELEKVMGRSDQQVLEASNTERHPMMRMVFCALLGAAAMLALVLVWQWTRHGDTASQPMALNAPMDSGMATIQTAEGEMIALTLADGTEVKLNGNSKVVYPHQFKGKERMVKLVGEAFFKVKHDSRRPFVVDAGGILTKDLGTSFNIRAYSDKDCSVTLVEGKVAVMTKGGSRGMVVLQPGEQFSMSQNTPSKVSVVNAQETTAWADGVYYYHDQTLEYIVYDLASHYQLKVSILNERAKSLHLDFSANRNGSVEETVELLNNLGVAKVNLKGGCLVVE